MTEDIENFGDDAACFCTISYDFLSKLTVSCRNIFHTGTHFEVVAFIIEKKSSYLKNTRVHVYKKKDVQKQTVRKYQKEEGRLFGVVTGREC